MHARGFYDLNLIPNLQSESETSNLIAQAFKLGYDIVAVNTVLEESILSSGKGNEIPKAPDLRELNRTFNSEKAFNFRPRQILNRVTFKISDPGQTHKVQSAMVKEQYDIIAVEPSTPKSFQVACTSMDIDIISFDLGSRTDFNMFHAQQMKLACSRGISFEISYSSLFHDNTSLRNSLVTARRVTNICREKGVIVSSMARTTRHLRSPYDVANLGFLFGFVNGTKATVSSNCRAVILKAECRKSGKGAIEIIDTADLNAEPSKQQGEKRKLEDEN